MRKEAFKIEQLTTEEEIAAALASCLASSASRDNKVLFSFLNVLGEPVINALARLTNASLKLEYILLFLKRARTVMLKKPGKTSYEAVSSWRPIALLRQ